MRISARFLEELNSHDSRNASTKVTKTSNNTRRFSKTLPFEVGTNQFSVKAMDDVGRVSAQQAFTYVRSADTAETLEYDVNGNLVKVYPPGVAAGTPGGESKRFVWDAASCKIVVATFSDSPPQDVSLWKCTYEVDRFANLGFEGS